eukprot:TRINITY_DN4201_c0_g1_i1.p1 TRINITY_DN4201_c0_g1~~TRINITY_DN4201_c0_g1_i1.p1  ORF type:complete len:164 (-),score=15.13 TRINITY_DN4201_c0_g1_i1:73-564(-)
MISFTIRSNNLSRLKYEIIKRQPPLYPGADLLATDIKYIARWTPPHFTEACTKNRDLKLIPDNSVVFWSRVEEIPRRHVTLDLRDKELARVDMPIKYVTRLGSKLTDDSARLNASETDQLIDLLVEKDESVMTLYRNFHQQPELFKRYSLRLLSRRQSPPKPS